MASAGSATGVVVGELGVWEKRRRRFSHTPNFIAQILRSPSLPRGILLEVYNLKAEKISPIIDMTWTSY